MIVVLVSGLTTAWSRRANGPTILSPHSARLKRNVDMAVTCQVRQTGLVPTIVSVSVVCQSSVIGLLGGTVF